MKQWKLKENEEKIKSEKKWKPEKTGPKSGIIFFVKYWKASFVSLLWKFSSWEINRLHESLHNDFGYRFTNSGRNKRKRWPYGVLRSGGTGGNKRLEKSERKKKKEKKGESDLMKS